MNVRTRMAPSPTGEYHIGHIRTVLFNYALAKASNGKFLIRIEDTDRERFVEGAVDRILDVIKDYGLDWDEGPRVGGNFAPYVQSERLDLYKKYAEELVESGHAYYCFCTSERLDALRKEQQEKKMPVTKYDKLCSNLSKEEVLKKLSAGEKHVIRLKVPENAQIDFHDEVLGDLSINSNDIDDTVLLKSDGFPTYHLAVVVDDHLMEVSHVMRGIDWLPSTPKHVLLYRAFGWEIPKLIHLPNLKEKGDNKKLSKRFGSVFAISFLEEGYLPEALVNFCMLLGWNPGTEQEIISLEEFIKLFSIEKLHKTDLVAFDRDKLIWMNGHYIRTFTPSELLARLKAWAVKFNQDLGISGFEDSYIIEALKLVQDRIRRLSEFREHSGFFFEKPQVDKALVSKYGGQNSEKIAQVYSDLYKNLDEAMWNSQELDKVSHEELSKCGFKTKEAFMTLRVLLTGKEATPPLFDVVALLGKKVVLERLASFKS